MPTNKKITELTELVTADLADDDVLPIVDISAGTTHKIQKSTLAAAVAGVTSVAATSPIAVDTSTGAVTVSTGTIPVNKGGTGATTATAAATALGVGTGDSPQFTAVNVGAASDTTLARASAGNLTVEGNAIYRAGGTDVPVTDGGTGASTLTDGGVLLGSGTGAITAMSVLADGEMIVGDGSTDPVAESGATLRTSIGVGTGDSPEFTGVNVGAASDTTLTRASAGDLNVEGNLIYRAGGTDVPIADGGTGASTASAAATALGVGTGDSPQFTAVNIGAATDTTLARASAGNLTVEGNELYRAGGTDVPVADGGTGRSTLTANYALLGDGTSAVQMIAPGTSGNLLTSNGSTWASTTPAAGGAGYFLGNSSGATGDTTNGLTDIFRVNNAALATSCTIAASTNASATGPLTVNSGVTVTVTGTLVII